MRGMFHVKHRFQLPSSSGFGRGYDVRRRDERFPQDQGKGLALPRSLREADGAFADQGSRRRQDIRTGLPLRLRSRLVLVADVSRETPEHDDKLKS